MYYAISVMMLGYTRTNGVVAFNSDTKEFLEITPALARRLIDQGQLKGLKWKNNEDGAEFVCDTEGWNQKNIPIKTACGKFRPMLNDYPGVDINSMYTVVRMLDTDYRGRLYEIISNKCCRVKVTEKNLRELAEITNIAGVWITDNEIKVADGVMYEDRRNGTVEKAVEAEMDVTPPTFNTMDEVFGDGADPVVENKEAPAEETKQEENKEETPVEEPKAVEEKEPTPKTKSSQGKKSGKTTAKR